MEWVRTAASEREQAVGRPSATLRLSAQLLVRPTAGGPAGQLTGELGATIRRERGEKPPGSYARRRAPAPPRTAFSPCEEAKNPALTNAKRDVERPASSAPLTEAKRAGAPRAASPLPLAWAIPTVFAPPARILSPTPGPVVVWRRGQRDAEDQLEQKRLKQPEAALTAQAQKKTIGSGGIMSFCQSALTSRRNFDAAYRCNAHESSLRPVAAEAPKAAVVRSECARSGRRPAAWPYPDTSSQFFQSRMSARQEGPARYLKSCTPSQGWQVKHLKCVEVGPRI